MLEPAPAPRPVWTEIDGVATVWVDAPGPFRAGLLFRTGRADETLLTAGDTHLIEHLALAAIGCRADRQNGFVGGSVTGFTAFGDPAEVGAFLLGVSRALSSLPVDRFDDERSVLAAEQATRSYDPFGNLLTWRYGAVGYGLVGMPEFGLAGATPERVRESASRRFNRRNAVLWLSGPPPAGLALELPDGVLMAPPVLRALPREYPCWLVDDSCGGVAAGAVVPRSGGSSIYRVIAGRRLEEGLRTDQAVSYSPRVLYEPLDAQTAHLILYADADRERRKELADAFGKVFERLASFDGADIRAAKEQLSEHQTGALAPAPGDALVLEAQRAAMDRLFGREFEPLEVLEAETAAVSAEEVSEVAKAVADSALFAVPGKATIQAWMGKRAEVSLAPPIGGRGIAAMDPATYPERLVHGTEGVSLVWPDGSHVTVRYATLAGADAYDDGAMRLVDADGSAIVIEPTLWRRGQAVASDVRAHIPALSLVPKGRRAPEAIPAPKRAARDARTTVSRTLAWSLLAVGIAFLALWLLVTAVGFGDFFLGVTDPVEVAVTWLIIISPYAALGALIVFAARILRRPRG